MTPFSLYLVVPLLLMSLCLNVSNGAEEYQTIGLQTHNTNRAKKEAPDLVLSEWLNEQGKKCAEYYVKLGKIDHSCSFTKTEKGERAGENLWMTSLTPESTSTDFKTEAENASNAWYNGEKDYSFGKLGIGLDTGYGQFSRVVWKKSKELGMGAFKDSKICVVVALYYPPVEYDAKVTLKVIGDSGSSSGFLLTASQLTIFCAFLILTLGIYA